MCFIKNNVRLLVGILLLCNIALNSCKRVLIHRNVTDTFRVGTNGCTNDPSICETRVATCQTNGRCLCGEDSPNFRNPLILESGQYGQTYGCTKSESISERHRVGLLSCQIKPFQVVPYTSEDRPTRFTADMNLLHCYLRNGKEWTRAKFPENAAEVNLEWLDASYVNLTVLNKNVYFKWKKTVQRLQGTIITLGVSCQITKATRQQMCLVAKVSGSRSADIIERPTFVPTQPSSRPTTSELSTTMTTSATTSDVSSTDTMTTSPRSSTRSSHSAALPCILKPFQVIPYSPEDPPTKFTVEDSSEERLLNCYLLNVTRGQSNDAAEMQLRWLDKSYVNLTVLNRDLFFKWKKPVPSLKGIIITISFSCQIAEKVRQRICLTAKVFGPSPTDIIGRSTSVPTQPSSTLTTSELSTTMPTSATTADVSSTDTMTTSPRSSTRARSSDAKNTQLSSPLSSQSSSTPTTPTENPDTTATSPAKPASQTDAVTTSPKSSPPDTIKSTFVTTKRSNKPTTYEGNLTNKLASPKLLTTSRQPREVPGSDGNFKWTLIAIAVVVPVLFFAVLVLFLCFLSKRKKNNQRYLRPGSFELRTSSSTSVQELRDIGANVRGLDHNDAIVTENLLYSTSEGQSAVVEVINPFYESFDAKNKNVAESDLSSDHRYETPDVRKRQDNGFQSTSGFGKNMVAAEQSGRDGPLPESLYETVDCEMTEVNGGPDLKKKTNDKADGKIGTANLYEDLDRVNSDLKKNEIDPKERKKETSEGNVGTDLCDDSDDETHDVKKIEYDGAMLDKLKVDCWDRTSLDDDGTKTDGKNNGQSSSGTKPVPTVGNLYTRVHRNENSKKDDDFNNTGSSSRLMIPGREDPNESGCHLNRPTESADTVREALLKK